jgi:hypothetical protein
VDLGGTWLRVLIEDAAGRRRIHRARAPSPEALPECLRVLWRRWRLLPRDVAALVVASRGVWTAAERRAAVGRVRALARRVHVTSDVEAAYLGALGHRPGVLLLAGTGSIALGRDAAGRWARAGGLGPLAGDEGSALWIGRQWLDHLAARSAPSGASRGRRRADGVARVAALAPRVLRAAREGSAAPRRIVVEARCHLAALVCDVARDLGLSGPIAVSWAGGVLADPGLRRGVWAEGRARGLRLSPRTPAADGAEAALGIARRLRSGATWPEPVGPRRPRRRRVSRPGAAERGAGAPRRRAR